MEPTAPATPVPAPAPQPARERFRVAFSGTAAEYFRVWIVNVALTIVTLGIYSAWAKVRNKHYFYGHSRLAGEAFEYTANPVNILKGRLLVFGVFAAYQLATFFQPLAAFAMAVLIVPLVPWVVIKAVGFNLRYSSYRGLRFHFDGRYGEAFRVYILWTLGIMASFGLLYPWVAWRRKQFLVDRARFGQTSFAFSGEVGWFYVVYIIAGIAYAGCMVGLMVLVTGAIAALAALGGATEGAEPSEVGKGIAVATAAIMYVVFLLLFIVLSTGVQAMIANHVWQHTRVDQITFDLRLNLWRVVWIQASNITAIILSLGLLIPWARVRMVRYRLSCFCMEAVPAHLEQFTAAERDRVAATGAELGDALDLDLGL